MIFKDKTAIEQKNVYNYHACSASEMTYIVSSGVLNSTHSLHILMRYTVY